MAQPSIQMIRLKKYIYLFMTFLHKILIKTQGGMTSYMKSKQ